MQTMILRKQLPEIESITQSLRNRNLVLSSNERTACEMSVIERTTPIKLFIFILHAKNVRTTGSNEAGNQ